MKIKNTRGVVDPSTVVPGSTVSASQLMSFMSCRRKWQYSYIDNLTPRVERAYLTIGKLCHVGMQFAMHALYTMQSNDPDEWVTITAMENAAHAAMRVAYDEYLASVMLLDCELDGVEAVYADALKVFSQAVREFNPHAWEVVEVVVDGRPVPALELHFCLPCVGKRKLRGYIDAVLRDRVTGQVWCVDYKFRSTLEPAESEQFNIQNAIYTRACRYMGIDITGTLTWQHSNTPASEPSVNKNGTVSRAKIKTTWDVYADAVTRAGGNPDDYAEEMIPKLADIQWFSATKEYRNNQTVDAIWADVVVPHTRAISTARTPKSAAKPAPKSLYPWNCRMCQFRSLCQAELRGYDPEYIRQTEFTQRATASPVNTDDKNILDN